MEMKHLYSSDDKLKWWGYGEWAEEPDKVTFTYKKFNCCIVRVVFPETVDHVFGGHLCGYIQIPQDHPAYGKQYKDIDLDVHGGVTYSKIDDENHSYLPKKGHWIGFDCAHYNDYLPSGEHLKKTNEALIREEQNLKDLMKKFNLSYSILFDKSYKNIAFCIAQCELMVDQLEVMKLLEK